MAPSRAVRIANLLEPAELHDDAARKARHALEHPEAHAVSAEQLPIFLAGMQQRASASERDASRLRKMALNQVLAVSPRWRARLVHSDDGRVRQLALENLE